MFLAPARPAAPSDPVPASGGKTGAETACATFGDYLDTLAGPASPGARAGDDGTHGEGRVAADGEGEPAADLLAPITDGMPEPGKGRPKGNKDGDEQSDPWLSFGDGLQWIVARSAPGTPALEEANAAIEVPVEGKLVADGAEPIEVSAGVPPAGNAARGTEAALHIPDADVASEPGSSQPAALPARPEPAGQDPTPSAERQGRVEPKAGDPPAATPMGPSAHEAGTPGKPEDLSEGPAVDRPAPRMTGGGDVPEARRRAETLLRAAVIRSSSAQPDIAAPSAERPADSVGRAATTAGMGPNLSFESQGVDGQRATLRPPEADAARGRWTAHDAEIEEQPPAGDAVADVRPAEAAAERRAGDRASDPAPAGEALRVRAARFTFSTDGAWTASPPAAQATAEVFEPAQAAEARAFLAETLAEADPLSQVVKAVRLQWRDGIGQATLRLQPENLGEVRVRLNIDHGRVVAAIRVEGEAVGEWLRSHEQELRAALADQGLLLDSLVVDPDGSPQQQAGDERARREAPRPVRRNPEARFEVRV